MGIRKLQKYTHERQKWYKTCTKKNCEDKYVLCSQGYPGHYVHWLDASKWKIVQDETKGEGEPKTRKLYRVVQIVAHAHFVVDKDIGRHCECRDQEKWIDEKHTELIRVIKGGRKLPGHVRDLLE